MSDDNKEGAAVPVAWHIDTHGVASVAINKSDLGLLAERYARPLGFIDTAAPPAVMPAAPSDAVTDERAAFLKWYDGSENRFARHERWEAWQARAALSQTVQPQAEPADGEQAGAVDVDALAQEIRRVDGSNSLGAGALAEALMPFLTAPGAAIAAREQEANPNAPWLTEAHMLCTDNGIPQGHIAERIQALRTLLASRNEAPATPQAVAGDEVTEEMLAAGAKFSSQPRATYKAMRAALTQPTTVQQADAAIDQAIARGKT